MASLFTFYIDVFIEVYTPSVIVSYIQETPTTKHMTHKMNVKTTSLVTKISSTNSNTQIPSSKKIATCYVLLIVSYALYGVVSTIDRYRTCVQDNFLRLILCITIQIKYCQNKSIFCIVAFIDYVFVISFTLRFA